MWAVLTAGLGVALAGCGGEPVRPSGSTSNADPSASPPPSTTGGPAAGLRYVALGDSYTIGTATRTAAERWPDQLVAALAGRRPTLELVANLGVNGFTSRDVIEVELPQLAALDPDFATILIGVNDVVQGVPPETYRTNAAAILDALLER
ncbi:MAG TPA: SGNH/GDSL hydrolase family protein, partial [Patescibacteria group bacterium]|nr:SGNH/GDSL hydrolase family protein [Patescibacteria group bacterium]